MADNSRDNMNSLIPSAGLRNAMRYHSSAQRCPGGPSAMAYKESIRDQVVARLATSYMGTAMGEVGKAFGSREEIPTAPLLSPPIATGMTESLERVHGIIMKKGPVSRAEMAEIPGLLRRLRYLLRVYYDAVITSQKTPDFKFCDIKDISDIGLQLHECGVFLQLSPSRLRAVMSSAPDFEAFILDEPLDIGKWRLEAAAADQAVNEDIEADDEDRFRVGDLEEKSGSDFAAYQMSYFFGDVLVAFLINSINQGCRDGKEQERGDKAMKKLVALSTDPVYRDACGDPLTDAMRPVYWEPKLTLKFAHAGGLPALIGDWAESCAKGLCEKAIHTLPSNGWDHQTPESLLGIMRSLIKKIEIDGPDFVVTPICAKIMHNIYSRYGIKPFERASRISWSEIVFYFLHRRLSRKGKKPQRVLQSWEEWRSLLKRYLNVPEATRQRHSWMILTVSQRWDCVTLYGCKSAECPERAELLELKRKRRRGVRAPEVEKRLYKWGAESKACTGCKHVSYCSETCQKADWKRHRKAECKTEAAKGKDEEM